MLKSLDADTAQKIVKSFGGTRAAARAFDCPPTTVQNWLSNGIPRWRVPFIQSAAERDGIKLPSSARAA